MDNKTKEIIMTKTVDSDDVKFVQIGNSGTNYCITISKNGLLALRNGKTFPIELIDGDKKKTIVVMRDVTFRKRMNIHSKLTQEAKKTAEIIINGNKEGANLGDDIGSSSD